MAQQTFSLASRVKLANGISMPQVHLGLYLTSGKETSQAVRWALEVTAFLSVDVVVESDIPYVGVGRISRVREDG